MASIDTTCTLEFHAFGLSAIPGRAPLIFITVPGASGLTGASGFSTSTDVKKRLARLLDVRSTSLKFYPDSDLHKFQRQRSLRSSLANFLDPRVDVDEVYNLPELIVQAFNHKENALSPSVLASHLQKTIRASRLSEDDPHANLLQLCRTALTATDSGIGAAGRHSCCQVRCSECNKRFPLPGYKALRTGPQKCSCCRGDPEGMRIITRRILALRLGAAAAGDAWEVLRVIVRRAVKAGHAEAVHCIASAGGHKQPFSSAELDLAIRSRRAGVLASILIRCPPHIVRTCLKATERHALAASTFGGQMETSLFFNDLRCRLLAVHDLIVADERPAELVQRIGCLTTLRRGFPKPARHLIWQYLSPDLSDRIISQLTEMLAGIEGLAVKIDW